MTDLQSIHSKTAEGAIAASCCRVRKKFLRIRQTITIEATDSCVAVVKLTELPVWPALRKMQRNLHLHGIMNGEEERESRNR